MSERIIIDFDDNGKDDSNKKKDNAGERIIIDFEDSIDNPEVMDISEIPESSVEKLLKSKVNSFYKGSSGLNNYFESELIFPEGIDNSFRKKFSLKFADEFFNTILENNKFIILSSGKGNIYFIDRFTGKLKGKLFFENDSFEKTGIVYENRIFINSLNSVCEINNDEFKPKEIYRAESGYYLWSNLNRYKDNIIFTEYNPATKKSHLKIINLTNGNNINEYSFDTVSFLSDRICINNNRAYYLFDLNILVYDFDLNTGTVHSLNKNEGLNKIYTDESSFIFNLGNKLFITTSSYEIYYLDLPDSEINFKFSGIKNTYINSTGGFEDNLFTGTLEGWKLFKSSGLQIYSYEDEFENVIECISRNILVVSKKNRIVFYNLNRFQEAESYVISSDTNKESIEIISAVISGNEIFVLTKNGILEVYTNDKLNIHI